MSVKLANTLCAGLLVVGLASIARSDEFDKKTVVTTNVPIEVPGRVLPPGSYVFKLLFPESNPNIVQILDSSEKRVYATVLAVPDFRLEPGDKPLLQFEEQPAQSPEAVKAWFYPGDQFGFQFVYPHERAANLAKRTKQNVLSMRDDMSHHMKTQSTSSSDSSIQSLKKADVTGVSPSGDPVQAETMTSQTPKK